MSKAVASSFRTNADKFMRDNFLFSLNESFTRFREDILHRDGQRKPDNPPFTLDFVVSQAYHLKRLNKQTSCWQTLLLKNSSITLHLRSPAKATKPPRVEQLDLETDPVFFWNSKQQHSRDLCPASAKTCSYCHKTRSFRLRLSAGLQRPASLQNHPPPPPPKKKKTTPLGARQEHIRLP